MPADRRQTGSIMVVAVIGMLTLATITAVSIRSVVNETQTVDEHIDFAIGIGVSDSMRIAVEMRGAPYPPLRNDLVFTAEAALVEPFNTGTGAAGYQGVVGPTGYRFYTQSPGVPSGRLDKGWTFSR